MNEFFALDHGLQNHPQGQRDGLNQENQTILSIQAPSENRYTPNAEALCGACGRKPPSASEISKKARFERELEPGRMHPAIHGRIWRSGCTPAEPYPPDRTKSETQLIRRLQLEPVLI
jgi:hypothetical protein